MSADNGHSGKPTDERSWQRYAALNLDSGRVLRAADATLRASGVPPIRHAVLMDYLLKVVLIATDRSWPRVTDARSAETFIRPARNAAITAGMDDPEISLGGHDLLTLAQAMELRGFL